SDEVLEVRDGRLTIRGVVATHPATIEAGHAVLNFEGVPVKPSGMLATLDDEYLPLRWELQHNTALRERVAEEVSKGDSVRTGQPRGDPDGRRVQRAGGYGGGRGHPPVPRPDVSGEVLGSL